MSRKCEITGKKPKKGRKYAIRGIAKKKKGIGLNITGKSKRRFLPNLLKKRIYLPNEKRFITLKLSAAGLKIIDKLGIYKALKKFKKNNIGIKK